MLLHHARSGVIFHGTHPTGLRNSDLFNNSNYILIEEISLIYFVHTLLRKIIEISSHGKHVKKKMDPIAIEMEKYINLVKTSRYK